MPWISGNYHFTREESENNAPLIWAALQSHFTLEAVSGMMGNMQSESGLNPGIWENLDVGNLNGGLGLVQWTPASKLIEWAGSDYLDGNKQCQRIIWELENGVQWYATDEYPVSFQEFAQSTESPSLLADMFLKNYERPKDPNQPIRGVQALEWYKFLSGVTPPTPTPKSSFNWIYYMKQI